MAKNQDLLSTGSAPADNNNNSSRLIRWLFHPIPIDWIVYFRIIFGGILVIDAYRYYQRIDGMFLFPDFQFKYYGFEWVTVWPGTGMYWHMIIIGMAAFWVMIGFCYRIATLILFLSFTYFFLLDQSYYLNHFYLVCTVCFLFMFLPAHRAFSIDAWLRPEIRSQFAPNWTLWLLRIQIAIPYIFGSFAKMESDWLSGVPMSIMLHPEEKSPFFADMFTKPTVIYFFTYAGLSYDLFIVPLLLWKPTRWLGVLGVIAFNMTNHWLFSIGIFPWLMMLSTPLFFPADTLRKRWLPPLSSGEEHFARWVRPPLPVLTVSLLSLLLAAQFLVPFRHFLYPEHVNWTEEGHRFAWHMKLRIKRASASQFYALSHTGELLEEFDTRKFIDSGYLNSRQARTMATRPDMILQFAHFLADEYARRHQGERVQINAYAEASLNRRPPQLLIDPEIDLAAEPRNLKHSRWILPLQIPYIELPSEKELKEFVAEIKRVRLESPEQ